MKYKNNNAEDMPVHQGILLNTGLSTHGIRIFTKTKPNTNFESWVTNKFILNLNCSNIYTHNYMH